MLSLTIASLVMFAAIALGIYNEKKFAAHI